MNLDELPYAEPLRLWVRDRYGADADRIWEKIRETYADYLARSPAYGGRKNGHANAIYGGLLVFAWYSSLPDAPPLREVSPFIQALFMKPFSKLGKVFNLNRPAHLRLLDLVFRKSGRRDRRDIQKYPAGFVNVDVPYDRENRAARYYFTQCPNAEFARENGLLHVLPLLCNCDYFGISELHGTLIRTGTCGNSSRCDYCVTGSESPLAREYETVTDEAGFLVSRKKSLP